MNNQSIEEIIQIVGDRIRSLRISQNMTQLELASASDIDVRQIQRLENGHTSASLKTLIKVCRGLSLTLGEFFGEGF